MDKPTVAQKFPFVQKTGPGTFWWCACGRSRTQPFCDGSHQGTRFAPVKMELADSKTIAWCGCKFSRNGALCDGSHGKLT